MIWSLLLPLAALAASGLAEGSAHRPPPKRPVIKPTPYDSGKPWPTSPPRDKHKLCYVNPACETRGDSAKNILKSFHECNNGGTVVLDKVYWINSPIDLTFLRHVDMVITGEIHFDDSDVYYWNDNSFKYTFQNQSVFWKIGGEDVNIYGDLSNDQSLIDGHGQKYWEEIQTNRALFRPMLLSLEGLHGGTMSNIRMRNPPNWFNIIANSTDIIISDMDLVAKATDGVQIANSDGWDTYRSDNIVIQNSNIINTDDCVSFKPNSTNVIIQGLVCDGSHGISVGSLGQYVNVTDIVEDLFIYNISMSNASDGARIKVWPGAYTDFQQHLVGGGGLGRVRNVTYDTFYHYNNDRVITITQCYGQSNLTFCEEHPANLTIEDITMRNFWGQASARNDPEAGTLVCSARDRCSNIRVENVTVTVPSGRPPVYECDNVDESLLDLACILSDDPTRNTDQG
ncbi:hypothetical protein S7711_04407 [Stachybotrys chartarum IBT 7711]|uniref:galacturonan 1,4-alpha-galacturonidase n=1 Tax=Stachybotrys chartarum (strain CBS 109288 / IBT 7711) TaxID=1280523 RepID=A0A084B5I9_STACB|nr:hypothetical protein S7711_04407 [Stachybotrys chartarum IBT 7711]